jgi:hypothetical protein
MSEITTQEMIESYLKGEVRDDIYTNVIPAHCAQMALFGMRQGIEFIPAYDPDGQRKSRIDRLINDSKIELYMRSLWDQMICTGSLLFFLRPTEDFYTPMWFNRSQFEAFYGDKGNVLTKIIIKYRFKVQESPASLENWKWYRLIITPETYRESTFDHDPSLAIENSPTGLSDMPAPNEIVTTNTLGIIPCIIVDNDPKASGIRGQSDFEYLSSQIETLNRMAGAVSDNLEFFGNPTLIATRPASQLVEGAGARSEQYRGVATSSGFQNINAGIYSTRKFDYSRGRRTRQLTRVRKVIGGVGADERFGYIVPDQVSGDQNNYINRYEEMIRTALGGVFELGFSAGATAFEIRSLFGKVAATAKRKANALYTHGICKMLQLMIEAEEYLFIKSLRSSIEWDEEKQGPFDAEAARTFVFGDPEQKLEPQPIPPTVTGLVPQGNATVIWRWTGPVFEDSAIEKQQKSILMRNLVEEGISTVEAFKLIYPDLSDTEIEAKLGGVPFRRVQRIIALVQQTLGLQSQLMQLPLASAPNIPSLAVYGQSLDQINARLFQKLVEELSRGQKQYEPTVPAFTKLGTTQPSIGTADSSNVSDPRIGGNGAGYGPGPNVPTGLPEQRRSVSQYGPGAVSPYTAAGIYDPRPALAAAAGTGNGAGNVQQSSTAGAGPNAALPNGQQPAGPASYTGGAAFLQPGGVPGVRMAGGIQSPGGSPSLRPEFTSPIPVPGATLSQWGANQYGQPPGQPTQLANAGSAYGSYDLATQPGLFAQLFPTITRATRSRKR